MAVLNPSGLCQCGCEEPAPLAQKTCRRRGWVKGQPTRFVNGHSHRGKTVSPETRARIKAARRRQVMRRGAENPLWKGDAVSYKTIHMWLIRQHPKSGVCEKCGGTELRTEYAFKRHPEPHTRDREDYLELCSKCHRQFDGHVGEGSPHWKGDAASEKRKRMRRVAA